MAQGFLEPSMADSTGFIIWNSNRIFQVQLELTLLIDMGNSLPNCGASRHIHKQVAIRTCYAMIGNISSYNGLTVIFRNFISQNINVNTNITIHSVDSFNIFFLVGSFTVLSSMRLDLKQSYLKDAILLEILQESLPA